MHSLLLAYTPKITEQSTLSDRLSMGLQTLALGMLIIFSVLILIWIILEIFHKVFAAFSSEPHESKKAAAPQAAPAPAPVQATPVTDDGATVAAITAALSLALEQPTTAFRVVSFRKVQKNSPWNQK